MTDTLQLNLSEDAYDGDAKFTVTLDGVSLGPAQAVTALHSAGATEPFTFTGTWGPGPHNVAVTFINDAYGGTPNADRNLYLMSANYDGQAYANIDAAMWSTGDTAKATVQAPGTDTLTLGLADDAYLGNAQFTVSLDGKQIGGPLTVTALHSAGAQQFFTFTGNWGTGPHNVVVTFLNDAYGGTPSKDRNLYLMSANYDGQAYANINAAMSSTGNTAKVAVQAPKASPDNTIVLAGSAVAIVDANDNTWTITSGGQVAVNGVTDSTTARVIELAYEKGLIWQENASGLWWSKALPTDAWATGAGTVNSPIPGATPTSITVTEPTTASLIAGNSVQLSSVDLADQGISAGTPITLSLADAVGTLSMKNAAGAPIPGSGSKTITVTDTLANINADLATLTYTAGTSLGSDTLTTTASAGGVTGAGTTVVSVTTASPDTLTVYLAEDAYNGNAEFTVTVNGAQVGGAMSVTTLQTSGTSQQFMLTGNWGNGPYTVGISFINDASGPGGDRNLYVDGAEMNGQILMGGDVSLYSNGTAYYASPASTATKPLSLLGVNLPSASFDSAALPGVNGTNYQYPSRADIDYYASSGMNVIRLGFLWERLQPVANGPLDPTQLGDLDSVVNYATTKGLKVDLDPHDFGQYYGNLVGSTAVPNSTFANFWGQLAAHYANNPNVIFGLMNEPNQQSATQWAASANAAIDAIRAAGATSQEILVTGTYWDSARDWTTTDNAQVVGTQVHDPNHNIAFEVHQYFDAGNGGTKPNALSPTTGVDRLQAVTQWAESTGNKLFLGEFGAGSDPTSLAALHNTLTYMEQHTDVWQGGTYWAGGPGWGNYMYSIQPTNGVATPQMNVLQKFLP